MNLAVPVSSEEVNPSGQGWAHTSLGTTLPKSNRSLAATPRPNKPCSKCGSQTGPVAHRFSCAKAQLRYSGCPPAQGKDTHNSPTATPTRSSHEPLGHVRIKTEARLSDKHRGASDLLWASSSEERAWLNSSEFVGPRSLRLLDSALCYKYRDFSHSLQAATLALHFSLSAD